MADTMARRSVNENLSASRGEKQSYPVNSAPRETRVTEQRHEKRPRHRIKRFGNINFQQHRGSLSSVQKLGAKLNSPKIIMNEPSLDEGTLIMADQLVELTG